MIDEKMKELKHKQRRQRSHSLTENIDAIPHGTDSGGYPLPKQWHWPEQEEDAGPIHSTKSRRRKSTREVRTVSIRWKMMTGDWPRTRTAMLRPGLPVQTVCVYRCVGLTFSRENVTKIERRGPVDVSTTPVITKRLAK